MAESNCGSRARLAFAVSVMPSSTPVDAEQAESPAVVGIDHDHEGEQQQRAEPERAEAGHQSSGPIRSTSSELEVDKFMDVLFSQFDQQGQQRRGRPARQARASAGGSTSATMSWLAGSRKATSGTMTIGAQVPPPLEIRA